MSPPDLTLDHVAVVVPDLDRAFAAYRRMGFSLSPRSSHKSRPEGGGPEQLMGSGNHCAMFERGYLEILGITDPDLPREHVQGLLDEYAGLHLIALGCEDALAMARVMRERLGGNPVPREVGRDVPLAGGRTVPGAFNILPLAEGAFREADLFCIEHLTPDALWRSEVIAQPNGVVGLSGVVVCASDRAGASARLQRILDTAPITRGGIDSFALSRGRIQVTGRRGLEQMFPGTAPPRPDWVAAVRFQVADLDATRGFLVRNGFTPSETADSSFWIGAEQAEGAVVVFSARED